jgi:hypothetical protein
MGLSHVPEDELSAWVERTCAEQGVVVGISDPVTVGKVVALLGGAVAASRAQARSASTGPTAALLQMTPDRLNPFDIKASRTGGAGEHDGVLDDGTDDGVLPVEVEVRPLSA